MSDLDDLDRQVLRLLARDGRRSYTDLAKDTGLSTSAVHQRVRRLEQRGAITGYRAVLDPIVAGLPEQTAVEPETFAGMPQPTYGFQWKAPPAFRSDISVKYDVGGSLS